MLRLPGASWGDAALCARAERCAALSRGSPQRMEGAHERRSPSRRAVCGLGSVQQLGLLEPAPEPIPKDCPARPGALLFGLWGSGLRGLGACLSVLDGLQPIAVVHGACGVDADRPRWALLRGADRLADAWCTLRQVPAIRVPARWSALGRRAGAVRNQQMLELYHPALLVAFPGHLGTADLVLRARAAGVAVWKPAAPSPSAPPRFAGRPDRDA